MGAGQIDNNLLSSSVLCVLAQRLGRKLCPVCRQHYQPDPKVLTEIKTDLPPDMKFYHADGCEECHGLGYRGQTGIFEMLPFSDEIRLLIQRNTSVEDIAQAARQAGMKTLREAGLDKVRQGVTTLEEVIRVTT